MWLISFQAATWQLIMLTLVYSLRVSHAQGVKSISICSNKMTTISKGHYGYLTYNKRGKLPLCYLDLRLDASRRYISIPKMLLYDPNTQCANVLRVGVQLYCLSSRGAGALERLSSNANLRISIYRATTSFQVTFYTTGIGSVHNHHQNIKRGNECNLSYL